MQNDTLDVIMELVKPHLPPTISHTQHKHTVKRIISDIYIFFWYSIVLITFLVVRNYSTAYIDLGVFNIFINLYALRLISDTIFNRMGESSRFENSSDGKYYYKNSPIYDLSDEK